MSIQRLRSRVNRIEQQLPQQRPVVADELDYSLFTNEEREQFLAILRDIPEDTRAWAHMPAPQWFSFSLWVHLYEALQKQDEARIAGYRYRLNFSDEQILGMFLSLATPSETDSTLHRFTPYGLVYSYVREKLLSTEEYEDEPDERIRQQRRRSDYRYRDEAWDWLVNAGRVEPLYHSHLAYQIETRLRSKLN